MASHSLLEHHSLLVNKINAPGLLFTTKHLLREVFKLMDFLIPTISTTAMLSWMDLGCRLFILLTRTARRCEILFGIPFVEKHFYCCYEFL